MQITINIADKQIKSAINELLDNEIFDQYDALLIKRAQFKKSVTAKDLFECPTFQARLAKAMTQVAEDAVADNLFETVAYDMDIPQVVAIIRSLDKINEEFQEEADALREAEEVKRMVKTLEKAGFKIVKA